MDSGNSNNNNNSPFNTYDPLLTNHLTNGQMGYLPNAQFMTPAQYGAFRTVPSGNYTTNQEMNPSLFYNFMVANRGFGILNTYNPSINPMRRNVMANRTIADAQTAIALGLGETGLSVGAGMMVGGIGGAVLGMGVGAIASAATAPYLDRLRHAREIQRASMSRITFGSDVASGLGQGFNMQASYNIGTSLRKMAASDAFFDKEDYDNMMRIGMDSGMFDFSNNADQYVRTLKTVQKNFKTMMTLFETLDMDEIGRQMKRMQAMGVSNERMGGIAGLEKTYSRMLGISQSDAVDMYGQQGALIANNLGIAGIHGSNMNLSVAGRLEAARRTGLLSPMQISALGGVSGAAQQVTTHNLSQSKDPSFKYALMGLTALNGDPTKIDDQALMDFINSDESVDKLVSKGLTNLNRYIAQDVGKNTARLENAGIHFWDNIQNKLGTGGYEFALNKWRLSQARMTGTSLENILAKEGMSPEQIAAFMATNSTEAFDANLANLKTTKNALIQDYIERTDPAFFRDLYVKARKGVNAAYDYVIGGFAAKRNIETDRDENKRAGVIAGASDDLYSSTTMTDVLHSYSHKDFTRTAARGDTSFFGIFGGDEDRIGTSLKNKESLQNIYNMYQNADQLSSAYSSTLDNLTSLIQNDPKSKSSPFNSREDIANALKKATVNYKDISSGKTTTKQAMVDAVTKALSKYNVGGLKAGEADLRRMVESLSEEQLQALIGNGLVNNSEKQRDLLKTIGTIDINASNNVAAGVKMDVESLLREMKSVYGSDLVDTIGINASNLSGLIADDSFNKVRSLIDKVAKDGSIADNNLSPILDDPKAMALLSKMRIKDKYDVSNFVREVKKSGSKGKSKDGLNTAYRQARSSIYQQMGYSMFSTLGEYGIDQDEFSSLRKLGADVSLDDIMKYMDSNLDGDSKRKFAQQLQSDLKSGKFINLNTLSSKGQSGYEGAVAHLADSATQKDLGNIAKEEQSTRLNKVLFEEALKEGLLSTAGKHSIDTLSNNIKELNDSISKDNKEVMNDLSKTLLELNNTLSKMKSNMGTPTYSFVGGN